MANETRKKITTVADLMRMFGPPPVLSSEDLAHYYDICSRFIRDLDPMGMLEIGLAREVIDSTWEIQRLVRHGVLAVERQFRQSQEFQQNRIAGIKKRRDDEIRDIAQKMGRPPSDFAKWVALECELDAILPDLDEVLDRIPTELEHARSLESAVVYLEQLDRLIKGLYRRRDRAIELLADLRSGLTARLCSVSNLIIEEARIDREAPTREIPAPTVVPNDGEA
jgi:hypothetical protein